MADMGFYEGLRWLNAVLGTVVWIWLLIRFCRRRSLYAYAVRLYLLTLSFYVFSLALGSWEAALRDRDRDIREYAFLMSNIALLITLLLTRKWTDLVSYRKSEDA